MSRISFAVLITAFLAGTMVMAQSNEPSLGEIARQKSAAKSKRVVTNEEIPPSPEADQPPVSAKVDAKPATATDAASTPQQSPDPQTRLQALTKDNQDLLKVIAQLQSQIEVSDDRSLIKTLGEAVQHAKTRMEQNNADIAKLKAAGMTAPSPDSPAPATATPPPGNSAK